MRSQRKLKREIFQFSENYGFQSNFYRNETRLRVQFINDGQRWMLSALDRASSVCISFYLVCSIFLQLTKCQLGRNSTRNIKFHWTSFKVRWKHRACIAGCGSTAAAEASPPSSLSPEIRSHCRDADARSHRDGSKAIGTTTQTNAEIIETIKSQVICKVKCLVSAWLRHCACAWHRQHLKQLSRTIYFHAKIIQ